MCSFKIPYVIPVAVGLCSSFLAAIPVSFGVIIYYIINTASAYESAVTNKSLTESMLQVSYLIESLVKDKQMIVLIAALAVTVIVVYIISTFLAIFQTADTTTDRGFSFVVFS